MGQAKKYFMDLEENHCRDKKVSSALFSDHQYIDDIFEKYGYPGRCDYTGKYADVVSLRRIYDDLHAEFLDYFESPDDFLPFDSSEDPDEYEGSGLHIEESGYIMPDNRHIMSTREALSYVGFSPSNKELLSDIVACFNEDRWVIRDTFEQTSYERMNYNWKVFSEKTVEESLLYIKDPVHDTLDESDYDGIKNKYSVSFNYIAERICANLRYLNKDIKSGTILYRCVNYNTIPISMSASNLWAPPEEYASAQRMSRKGQSRLYVCYDKDTPLKEAVPGTHHCLAKFQLKKDIKVIDFAKIDIPNILNVPNVFDYDFFYKFADLITEKVAENEKYKYVPTQIMRDIIEEHFMESEDIIGIEYRSVKGSNTNNLVLFLDNNTCADYLDLIKWKEV